MSDPWPGPSQVLGLRGSSLELLAPGPRWLRCEAGHGRASKPHERSVARAQSGPGVSRLVAGAPRTSTTDARLVAGAPRTSTTEARLVAGAPRTSTTEARLVAGA